jgi:hypothetical protein
MGYIKLFENYNNYVEPNDIKVFLLEYYNFDEWKKFVDSQEMGQCQEITKVIQDKFNVKRMFGSIVYDEESDYSINHYWIEFNGKMYDYAKGTLNGYLDFGDELYNVEVGDFWSLYVPF